MFFIINADVDAEAAETDQEELEEPEGENSPKGEARPELDLMVMGTAMPIRQSWVKAGGGPPTMSAAELLAAMSGPEAASTTSTKAKDKASKGVQCFSHKLHKNVDCLYFFIFCLLAEFEKVV